MINKSARSPIEFKSLLLLRVAEFIYIEGDNKRVCIVCTIVSL